MDWTGNKNSTFTCLGASNHTNHDRAENDYYATDPLAAKLLLEVEPELNNIWECACGKGHLAKVFGDVGKLALATDLIDRGFGTGLIDFLCYFNKNMGYDIVTNPPYKYAKEFVEKWSAYGPSHHCAIGVGHVASKLFKIGQLMNMEVIQIC